jgi:hypothetical protein
MKKTRKIKSKKSKSPNFSIGEKNMVSFEKKKQASEIIESEHYLL